MRGETERERGGKRRERIALFSVFVFSVDRTDLAARTAVCQTSLTCHYPLLRLEDDVIYAQAGSVATI